MVIGDRPHTGSVRDNMSAFFDRWTPVVASAHENFESASGTASAGVVCWGHSSDQCAMLLKAGGFTAHGVGSGVADASVGGGRSAGRKLCNRQSAPMWLRAANGSRACIWVYDAHRAAPTASVRTRRSIGTWQVVGTSGRYSGCTRGMGLRGAGSSSSRNGDSGNRTTSAGKCIDREQMAEARRTIRCLGGGRERRCREVNAKRYDCVCARLNRKDYPKGIKISDEQMQQINLRRYTARSKWNYSISPS